MKNKLLKKGPKRNPGDENYNNWNEKLTSGVQNQKWTGKIINKLEERIIDIYQVGGTERKTNEEKWTKLNKLLGHHPVNEHTHCGSPRKREMGRKDL